VIVLLAPLSLSGSGSLDVPLDYNGLTFPAGTPLDSNYKFNSYRWKRVSGRAQQPAGPTTRIFHCVANTVGQSPDGRQTSSGQSFIRNPDSLPLAEAGFY
jgi:hypothetical protein